MQLDDVVSSVGKRRFEKYDNSLRYNNTIIKSLIKRDFWRLLYVVFGGLIDALRPISGLKVSISNEILKYP